MNLWRSLLVFALTIMQFSAVANSMTPISHPIIDVHVHAFPQEALISFGLPQDSYKAYKDYSLSEMERLNIYGFVGGDAVTVKDWKQSNPQRIFSGYMTIGWSSETKSFTETFNAETIKKLHIAGELDFIGEVATQYLGKSPNDPYLSDMWAVAEKLQIPVGYHMGNGPHNGPHNSFKEYKPSMGNPLLFEDVLYRHPNLRLFIMHAGWPMLHEMIYLLQVYPNVNVGIGALNTLPDSPNYIKALINSGYEDRIMFGSDQMAWPERFQKSVDSIQQLEFLSEEQKQKIFYKNAMKFFKIDKRHFAEN